MHGSLLTLILVNSYFHARPGTLRERLRRVPCRQHERVFRYHCSHICCKGRCRGEGRDRPVPLSAVHCTSMSRPLLCAFFLLKSEPEIGIARPRELTYTPIASLPKTKRPQRDLRLPRQPHLRLPELRPRPRGRVVRGRQL